MEKISRKELVVGAAAAFVIQLIAIWPARAVYLVLQDEGNLVAWASRLLKGQLPYQDFFMRFMPGTPFGISVAFRILGEEIWAARLYFMVSLGLLCSAIWLVSRALMPRNWSVWPPLLFVCVGGQVFPLAVHHWDASVPALLALVASAYAKRPQHQMLAGALAGLTVVYLQPRGVAICLAVGVMVLVRSGPRLKRLSYLIAGAAIPGAIFVGWLLVNGIFAKFWRQAILFNVQGYAEAQGYPFDWGLAGRQLQTIWDGLGSVGEVGFASWCLWLLKALPFALVDIVKYTGFFPVLVLLALDFGFRLRREGDEKKISLILGLQVLLWLSAYFALARATRYQFNFLTVAWYPVFIFLLYRLSLRFARTAKALTAAVVVIFVFHGADNVTSWSQYRFPILFPRGVLYSNHPQIGQATQQLSRVLSEQFQQQNLFAFPELPLLVWMVGANNPTDFERLVPIYYPPELLEKAEQQIRSADRCGVLFLSVAESIRQEYPQIDADRYQREEAALLERLTKGAESLGQVWLYKVYRFPEQPGRQPASQ